MIAPSQPLVVQLKSLLTLRSALAFPRSVETIPALESACRGVFQNINDPLGKKAAFGSLPDEPQAAHVFARNILSDAQREVARQVTNFSHSAITPAIFREQGLTPARLEEFVTYGVLAEGAMRAFNRSGAKYLADSLASEHLTMGYVLQAAVEARECINGKKPLSQSLSDVLLTFEDIAGAEVQIADDSPANALDFMQDAERARMLSEDVEMSLHLLAHYRTPFVKTLFEKHGIETGLINRAVTVGLISEKSARDLFEAVSTGKTAETRRTRLIKALGYSGMTAAFLVWLGFIKALGFSAFKENTNLGIPFIAAIVLSWLVIDNPKMLMRVK